MPEKNNEKDDSTKFLTVKEAAVVLRINPRTMANWRSKGTGPKWRKHGGTVVYSMKELIRYSGDDDKTHVG